VFPGLGAELARAVAVRDTGLRKALPADVDELIELLGEWVGAAMAPFVGVDRSATGYDQLMAAQERIATVEARAAFAMSFLRCEGLFELMWPDERLRSIEADYRWQLMPGVGHFPHEEDPHTFTQVLLEWLLDESVDE